MQRFMRIVCCGTVASCAAIHGLNAHAGNIETVQFDITELPLNIFGVQLSVDYLGPNAGTIVDTRAELTYINDGPLDAADIILTFQAPSEGVPIWQFSGADLGWSGTGTFEASISTDTLNGLIDLGDPPPDFSLFLLVIQAEGFQPLSGQFSGSFFQVDVASGPPPILGDLNGDGLVNASDLAELLGAWGRCPDPPEPCDADLDGDGNVNAADLAILLGNWT